MSQEIKIIDIKAGDAFCEFDGRGHALRFVAVGDARVDGDYWKVRGKTIGSEDIVDFLVDKNFQHYAPKLYSGHEVPYNNVTYIN